MTDERLAGRSRRPSRALLALATVVALFASSCASDVPAGAPPATSHDLPGRASPGATVASESAAPALTILPGATGTDEPAGAAGADATPYLPGPDATPAPPGPDATPGRADPGGGVTPAPVDTPPSGGGVSPGSTPPVEPPDEGIHKIKHVVVIMQENRSFDSYFGMFPGADGIPMENGVPTVCAPNPVMHSCDKPYHDTGFVDAGARHRSTDAKRDVNGGKMNGFIKDTVVGPHHFCPLHGDPLCAPGRGVSDVMGYKTAQEIPNYWAYAQQFVLQDHMFEPVESWSLPSHLFMVSAWSAACRNVSNPMSCQSALDEPARGMADPSLPAPYAWTDITYLLHRAHVSWRYYVSQGSQPDCPNESFGCVRLPAQGAGTPSIWNPLPWFSDVRKNRQITNVQGLDKFYNAAAKGKLPSVSWIVPDAIHSEHPPQGHVDKGQAYVTRLVNAVMRSPDWSSTAIFISWDDWGGFYDHVVPPKVDGLGFGIRVPGLVISPYAKKGYIDHQTLSFDAFLKFIEDDFLGGARLDPKTDGRPDSRPDVRENNPLLGDLRAEFDFTQTPRPPLILNPRP